MAAAACRSNCRACRSSIARAILPAIAVSAFAAISTAWRGSPRCGAMNSSVSAAPAAPEPLAADIVQAGPAPDSRQAESPARRLSARCAQEMPPQRSDREVRRGFRHRDQRRVACRIARADRCRDFTPTDLETPWKPRTKSPTETPKNVLPFRPPGDAKSPSLTPVENSAFNELARQLSARLETEMGATRAAAPASTRPSSRQPRIGEPAATERQRSAGRRSRRNGWRHPEPPARGEARRDKALLDLLPVGILIYRLDRLLYANPAFLDADGLCRACTRWRMPAASTRSMSSPASRTPAARRTPARR